jgi:hypothetical protein
MVVLEDWYAKNDGRRLTSAAVEYLSARPPLWDHSRCARGRNGICTRHSLSVSAESAERPSPSAIILYKFQTPPTVNMATAWLYGRKIYGFAGVRYLLLFS